jgi:hypothetical protein
MIPLVALCCLADSRPHAIAAALLFETASVVSSVPEEAEIR